MKKQPTGVSTAEYYHELTKYSPESISTGTPDPLQKPPLFKEYLTERALDLKPFLKGVPHHSGSPENPKNVLRSISRLLYHTGGITEIVEGRGGPIYFRAAPSAGALYPIEIYMATRGVEGITDGIHSYSIREHALVPLWDGNFAREIQEFCFRHPAAVQGRMFLILTAVLRRSAWRYRDRAYRRILLDAGHILGNAAAYAPVEGLGVIGLGGFHDAAISDLLFLDREEEAVLVVAPVVSRKDLETAKAVSPFPFPSNRSTPPSAGPDKGLMLLLHERSCITPGGRLAEKVPKEAMAPSLFLGRAEEEEGIPLGSPEKSGSAAPGHAPANALAPSIGPVIRRRRSARAFGKGRLTLARIAGILRSSYAPVRAYLGKESPSLGDCILNDPTMIATYLVATRVEGLPPGIYRYDPEAAKLHLRREGNFQNELWNICLGQDLGRNPAAAVIHVADLPACADRYGDRAYRYLHLDAGHLGQRINLAAVSRDTGVSGIGGFFDDEVNTLLEIPERMSTLYITLLGPTASSGAQE